MLIVLVSSLATGCGQLYDTTAVMNWQGTYYFVRGVLRWN